MTLTFSMWFDGHKRLLQDVLRGVPADTDWQMKWFDGSVVSGGMSLPPVDTPIDLALSSADLMELAQALTDLNEIVLIGCCGGVNFGLESQDSTRWVFTCPTELAATATHWFRKFSPIYS